MEVLLRKKEIKFLGGDNCKLMSLFLKLNRWIIKVFYIILYIDFINYVIIENDINMMLKLRFGDDNNKKFFFGIGVGYLMFLFRFWL